jgi:hypothetical protein
MLDWRCADVVDGFNQPVGGPIITNNENEIFDEVGL